MRSFGGLLMDADDSREYRRALVQTLQRDGHLHSARVADALLAVPRELFVPGVALADVYCPSEAIVTKRLAGVSVSSASAPEVIALMLEQLDPQPGQRVLEIGAGTGYNAALLAHMVGETGHVVTVDIDEDLVLSAREHLRAAGCAQVTVVQADGALGYPSEQAYDRIILTVASNDIAPAWREQLARPHGRLVMPLGLRSLQRCVAFVIEADHLVSRSMRNCSFIPLRGLLSVGAPRIALDAQATRVLSGADEPLPQPTDAIAALLDAPLHVFPSGVWTSLEALREGLHLWLVAHLANVYTLWGGGQVPDLFRLPERLAARGTLCILDGTAPGLALLAWADDFARDGELLVLAPEGSRPLAARVEQLLHAWVAAGRPTDADAEVRAYPRTSTQAPLPGEVAIDQRWTRFVVSWSGTQPPASLTV
jgi:protein-L-isoaspartate(D-aspartate) O-methyltransferase